MDASKKNGSFHVEFCIHDDGALLLNEDVEENAGADFPKSSQNGKIFSLTFMSTAFAI